MNKDIFEGKWEEVKGSLKKKFGKLTDDDLKQIEGENQKLHGILQQKYGYTKDEIDKAINN